MKLSRPPPPPVTFQEESRRLKTLLDNHLRNGSWPGRGLECTQLCLRSFVPLLKGKHSPPSSLATHTCLCSPSQSRAGPGTQCPFQEPDCLPRGWPLVSGTGIFAQEPPVSCPFHRRVSEAENVPTNSCPGPSLELFHGMPLSGIKQSLPLIPLGD